MRTDDNRNPAAFTTDIAKQAKLVEGTDYVQGTQFPNGEQLWTAKLLGDPVALTIHVIDAIGFYNHEGAQRWDYIAWPKFLWMQMTPPAKRDAIGFMYEREGGIAMRDLFPNYGKQW